ncbi:MAG: hypothetical protein RJA22_2899 [Verrucomicrobiota bacterium]
MDPFPSPSDSQFELALKTRREALQEMGVSLGLMFVMGATGLQAQNSPAQARAKGTPWLKLTPLEGRTLEALGDTLLPGAAAAGIAHYIDRQLASDTPLLMLKYLDFPMAFLDFYRQGLAALEALAQRRLQRSFADLTAAQRTDLVRVISGANPDGWNGPPAPLFYFATRSDAVDVVYGTPEGFGKLGVPYLPHIAPRQKW